jgi:hypothetical protein
MPSFYRVMRRAAQGGPEVGQGATKLGVRIPRDIEPAEDGTVSPGIGGMSVSPSIETLPPLSFQPACTLWYPLRAEMTATGCGSTVRVTSSRPLSPQTWSSGRTGRIMGSLSRLAACLPRISSPHWPARSMIGRR